MQAKLSIAVVHGGTSSERACSTANALNIARGLETSGHQVKLLDFAESIREALEQMQPDLVFVAVQGKAHGDGTLQAICEELQLPYTGSKTAAAALINNKHRCKELCLQHGIPTPEFLYLGKEQFFAMPAQELLQKIEAAMPYPVLAKAVGQGGGFGIEYIGGPADYPKIADALRFDDEIIIERFIAGDFITSAVLEICGVPTVLPVLSIRLEGQGNNPIDVYSNSIYHQQITVLYKTLSDTQQAAVAQISRESFHLFKARNYARIDLMLEAATGQPYFLEINGIPGLVEDDSFFPRAAESYGFTYQELVQVIVDNEMQGGTRQCAI